MNKVTTLTSFIMNGKIYNAGDDITDLFTFSFDKATNTKLCSAKQEYLDAINQPENKTKTQQLMFN